MQAFIDSVVGALPRVVGALIILIVGLIIAAIAAAVVRGALRRTGLDRRLAQLVVGPERAQSVDIAGPVGRAVFYLLLLFVLIAVFNALNLTLVTAPLSLLLSVLLGFLPRLLAAGLLLLLAWVLATVLRTIVHQGLRALRLDERVGQGREAAEGAAPAPPLSRTLAEVAYWLVFLFFLPTILDALGLAGLLQPVQTLFNAVLGFLPRLLSAALILVVGVFVARLVRRIVSGLLAAAGVDGLAARLGLGGAMGTQRPSDVLGLVVYVLILLPVITAALDALQLVALTQPISNMLNRIMAALPNIVAAVLLLVLAYAVGRVLAQVVTGVLAGVGFDTLPARLGLARAPAAGAAAPSRVAGTLVLAAVLLFAAIEALELLGFGLVAGLFTTFVALAGRILLGLLIFAIGLYLARLADRAIRGSGTAQAGLLAVAARGAILVLAGAMALRQMGVADDIINLAFGLLLGAAAVAAAIAFGVGGRDVAGRELERWVGEVRSGAITPPPPPPPPGETTPMAPPAPFAPPAPPATGPARPGD